jgi:energy-coupling factor transport system permease protein
MSSPLTFWSLDKKTPLHMLDPRVKILLIATVMYVAFILVNDVMAYVVLHIIVTALIIIARVPRITRIYMISFCASTITGLTIMGSLGFRSGVGPANVTVLTTLLGYPLYLEGIMWGLVISFKTTLAFLIGVVLASTTDPSEMLVCLSKLGMPMFLSFGITVTLRLIPLFSEEYINISNSIDLRGMRQGGIARRFTKFKMILEPLLISSLRRSTELGNAIQVRAFGTAKRTTLREIEMRRSDWAVTMSIFGILATLTYLRFVYGFLGSVGFTYYMPF